MSVRRVLHVIETLAPHEGGPPRVVAGLAAAQTARGIEAHVLCADGTRLAEIRAYWRTHAPGFPVQQVHSPCGSAALAARGRALREWLADHLTEFDLAHVHQLWRLLPTLAGRACAAAGQPYVIAPHTSLSPWALAQKQLKKQLARVLVWNGIFRRASGFHALNELEAEEIRAAVGERCPPVFVVPNGVSLDEFPGHATVSVPPPSAGPLWSADGARRYILFLARLHVMKGPDVLLDAFARIVSGLPGLQLAFAGPDYGEMHSLQGRVNRLGLAGRVHFLGPVAGSERIWLLENALCLSQPSRDEGFSLSILEAMACGRPVVISDRCKFPDVARFGAGQIVPVAPQPCAAALSLYARDSGRACADGRAARTLVEQSYTWNSIAGRTEQMYCDIVSTGVPRRVSGPLR